VKKSKSKVMTLFEASDFFDEHDIFETGAPVELSDIKFDLTKKRYVGLDERLYKKIKSRAKKLHISEDALIQDWLMEKVG
jgi:hypothetical protein